MEGKLQSPAAATHSLVTYVAADVAKIHDRIHQLIRLCAATLSNHLGVLLVRAGDVVQAVLEAGGLANSARTTTHHLLICGDDPSHVETRGFRYGISLLQAVNPSGEGSATRVLLLHSARFPVSSTVSHKSSMLYLTTLARLFLCLPRLRCP